MTDIDQRRTVTVHPSIIGVIHRTLALVVLSAGLLHAQGPTALLHGRVMSAESGDPIRNARVKLPDDVGSAPVLTDEDGRFALASVAASQRSISVEKTGYAGTTAAASDGVEIRMVKSGAISGRVVDDFGEPMPLVTVLAERVIPAIRRIPMERVAAAETDDRGVYRLSGLSAGEFIVAMAAGRTFDVNGSTPVPPALLRAPQHFYQNATTPQQAQPITVGSGDDVVGIDLVMPLPPAGMIAPRDALPPARPGAGGSIRGRVARADRLPLRRAQVRLSFPDSLLSPSVTDTDDDGQYEFRGLKPGAYRVTAMSLSFQAITFGRHGSRGDAVPVAAGALVDHVDISVPRTSAISGRVLDEYGDPMANANVRVQRIEFSKGRRRLVSVRGIASRQTNDAGAYRIFGLPPGRYLVSVVIGQAVPGWETADWPGYSRTFFPATPVATEAEAVEASAEQDRLNVDIALVRGHIARVAGHAFTAAGEPMQGVLWLSPSYRSGAVATPPVSARAQSDGAFEFTDLPPGEYVIQAARSWVDLATDGEFVATWTSHHRRRGDRVPDGPGGVACALEVHRARGDGQQRHVRPNTPDAEFVLHRGD